MQASLKIAWNLGHGISMSVVSTLDVHYNSDIFLSVLSCCWLQKEQHSTLPSDDFLAQDSQMTYEAGLLL